MKLNFKLCSFLIPCGSLLAASSLQAASLYWDATPGTPDGASQGGAGTWDTATANWDNGASYELWNNGSNNTAVFAGTAGTVTIDTLDDLGVTVGGLSIGNGYTIAGEPLTFGAAGEIDVSSGTGKISAEVAGSVGITKTGGGTLQLLATNSFTGNTTISGGTLRVGDNNTAATLGPATYDGDISIASGSTLLMTNSTSQTFSGEISGGGTVNKGGSGILTLSGANTYTGKTQILGSGAGGPGLSVSSFNSVTSGVIDPDGTPIATPSANSSLGAPITVDNGTIELGNPGNQRSSTLIYTGPGETTDRVITLGFNSGSIHTISSDGTGLLEFTSPFTSSPSSGTSTSGLKLGGDNDGEITNGLPFFPGILSKDGAGTWTLGGNNLFMNPVQLNGGVLSIAQPIGAAGIAKTVTTNGNATVTVNPDTTGLEVGMTVYSANNKITAGQTIVSIDDANTITLSANTNGGGGNTNLDARFGFSIGSIGFATSDPANLRWVNSATLEYTGPDDSTDRGFTVDNGDTGTWDIIGGTTLTVSGDSAATSGKIAKAGAGTLVLSGTLLHTGTPNAVSEGTVMIHGDASAMTGAVEVAGDATFGGTGTIGGDLTVADTGGLTFDLSTAPGGHDKLDVTGALTLPTGPETSELTITSAGGATTGTYTLLTATGAISGDAPVTVNLPGGWTADAPQIIGNDLQINITSTGGGGTTYASWSGGAAADDDTNGDGVRNAVAYALGAADVSENAIGLLPDLDNTTDPTYLIFSFNRSDEANDDPNTTISVEYGNDLVGWTTAVDDGDNVIITETPGSPTDGVEVKLKRSSIGAGGKLFARLKVTVTP